MVREMLEGEPPYMDLPSAKALFLIITKGLPPLPAGSHSKELRSFLDCCLTKNPAGRADAMQLLQVDSGGGMMCERVNECVASFERVCFFFVW
jgi:serine/threonine protein kinase